MKQPHTFTKKHTHTHTRHTHAKPQSQLTLPVSRNKEMLAFHVDGTLQENPANNKASKQTKEISRQKGVD